MFYLHTTAEQLWLLKYSYNYWSGQPRRALGFRERKQKAVENTGALKSMQILHARIEYFYEFGMRTEIAEIWNDFLLDGWKSVFFYGTIDI